MIHVYSQPRSALLPCALLDPPHEFDHVNAEVASHRIEFAQLDKPLSMLDQIHVVVRSFEQSGKANLRKLSCFSRLRNDRHHRLMIVGKSIPQGRFQPLKCVAFYGLRPCNANFDILRFQHRCAPELHAIGGTHGRITYSKKKVKNMDIETFTAAVGLLVEDVCVENGTGAIKASSYKDLVVMSGVLQAVLDKVHEEIEVRDLQRTRKRTTNYVAGWFKRLVGSGAENG